MCFGNQQVDRDPRCPTRIPTIYSEIVNRVLNSGGTHQDIQDELAALKCAECGNVDCRGACAR